MDENEIEKSLKFMEIAFKNLRLVFKLMFGDFLSYIHFEKMYSYQAY